MLNYAHVHWIVVNCDNIINIPDNTLDIIEDDKNRQGLQMRWQQAGWQRWPDPLAKSVSASVPSNYVTESVADPVMMATRVKWMN